MSYNEPDLERWEHSDEKLNEMESEQIDYSSWMENMAEQTLEYIDNFFDKNEVSKYDRKDIMKYLSEFYDKQLKLK